jgi:anti-anti-sigma factor
MEFQDFAIGDIVVFALSGKIMVFTECEPVRAKIKAYLDSNKKSFIFDMTGVPWINSDGIALLASIHATLAKAGGRIVLTNISEKVDHVLTVTKCSSIIRHFNSQADALAFLSAPD